MPRVARIKAEVAEITRHHEGLATYRLALERPAPRFKPGQFLHLALDPYDPASHWPESRVFSIASPPESRESLRITLSAVGEFTRRMLSLEVGNEVWVKLPYGDFVVEASPEQTSVLIAGGTGVTPFISLLESTKAGLGPILVLYGARQPELLIYRDVLEQAAAAGRAKCRYFVQSGAGGPLEAGLPTAAVALDAAREAGPLERAVFYVSGPPAMLNQVRAELSAAGVAADRIRHDAWD
jgi:ferredoxin-NADP reductase